MKWYTPSHIAWKRKFQVVDPFYKISLSFLRNSKLICVVSESTVSCVRLELYIILLIQKKTDLCWHRMLQQGIFPRFLRILQPSYLEILEKLWINDQLTLEISVCFSKLLKGPTTYTENKLVFLQKLHLNLMVLRFYVRQ